MAPGILKSQEPVGSILLDRGYPGVVLLTMQVSPGFALEIPMALRTALVQHLLYAASSSAASSARFRIGSSKSTITILEAAHPSTNS